MINLEQIKADIAARKAMPAWGPQTSIERIRTINATLPSFSLKTVEALVEMLESRTVTVKLPKPISVLHRRDFIDSHRAIYAYPEAEVNAALARAGIKLEAE